MQMNKTVQENKKKKVTNSNYSENTCDMYERYPSNIKADLGVLYNIQI